jgi:hypothetical protein
VTPTCLEEAANIFFLNITLVVFYDLAKILGDILGGENELEAFAT